MDKIDEFFSLGARIRKIKNDTQIRLEEENRITAMSMTTRVLNGLIQRERARDKDIENLCNILLEML